MSTVAPLSTYDLDDYRARYRAGMLYQDHRAFYDRLGQEYPDQNYYSVALVRQFLRWANPTSVVELGGWDGGLAKQVMWVHPTITSWRNYEIADVPQICDETGYERILPPSWAWEHELEADAFISSHTLEHLTHEHLCSLIDAVECRYAYVDVPLEPYRINWDGSPTTHILEISINEFDAEWESCGWRIMERHYRDGIDTGVPSNVRFMERTG